MSSTILFCLNPAMSHIKPGLVLVNRLIKKGYCVIFFGFCNTEKVLREMGYTYISIDCCSKDQINNALKNCRFKELVTYYRKINEQLIDVIKKEKIDISIIDISRFKLYFLPLYKSGVPIINFFSTCGPVNINKVAPPCSSSMIPKKINGSIYVMIKWIIRWIKREMIYYNLFHRFYYPNNEIKKVAKDNNLIWMYGIDGPYLNFPKLVFAPKELEFFQDNDLGYLGLCMESYHKKQIKNNKNTLIYCSLGTLSYRYSYAKKFFNTIIRVAKNNPSWEFVISLGTSSDIEDYKDIPHNAKLFKYVNQIDILKKAAIVLSHGGFGTIKECIMYSVPLIVFPCTYDQPGNAARVHYHQIGIRSNIRNANVSNVDALIKKVLYSDLYKNNIIKLKHLILNSSNDDGMHIIENVLQRGGGL